MIVGGNLIPAYGPIDHQLARAIRATGILGHWVIPPMTCAGSQGLEGASSSTTGGQLVDAGDRIGCMFCCNRYYNLSTLLPLYTLDLQYHALQH